MKKKSFLVTAIVVISFSAFVAELTRRYTGTLLLQNVEALTETESAPGESENCQFTGNPVDHCCYYYNEKNYNIEFSINKKSQ